MRKLMIAALAALVLMGGGLTAFASADTPNPDAAIDIGSGQTLDLSALCAGLDGETIHVNRTVSRWVQTGTVTKQTGPNGSDQEWPVGEVKTSTVLQRYVCGSGVLS